MCFGGNLGGCEARRLWRCYVLMARQANFGGLKTWPEQLDSNAALCKSYWSLVRAASRLIGRLPGGYRASIAATN